MAPRKRDQTAGDRPVSLKILADYLGLCPATVSVVLNNVPGRSIPQETRERVSIRWRTEEWVPSGVEFLADPLNLCAKRGQKTGARVLLVRLASSGNLAFVLADRP